MPNHFSTVGFPVSTQEDLQRLVLQARDKGKAIPSHRGLYRLWKVGKSIELWLGYHHEFGFGINPHVAGEGRMRITVTAIIPDQGHPLDGSIQGRASFDPRDPHSETFPLMLDLPDFDAQPDLHTDSVVTVQIAAFAHELACYETEEAFADSQGEVKFAPESFIPSGLFSTGEDSAKPAATAIFSGHVEQVHLLTNPKTNASFYHLVVRTLGGTVDVVADPEIVQGTPTAGSVLHGSFWLSGRIMQEQPKRASIIQRLLGRNN